MYSDSSEQEEFERVERKDYGAFYFIKDSKSGFLVITLGYKDKDQSKNMEAKIAPTEGSNLFKFKIGEYNIIYYDPKMPLADYVTGTPVLFPFPNRIENAMWTWKGKTYLQKKDGIPIQLHSLVYDEVWEYTEPEFKNNSVFFSTYINVDENHPIYKGYPFKFKIVLKFTLNASSLCVTYKVENRDKKDIPFGFALHPYFTKLSGKERTLISVPALYWYERRSDVDIAFLNKNMGTFSLIPNILPSGKLISVYRDEKNLLNPVPVGNLNLNDVYTGFLQGYNSYIDYTTIRLKLNLLCSNDFKHTVVYTPQDKPYFCIEPQTCSTDAINLYAKNIDSPNIIIIPQGFMHIGTVCFVPEYY